jgi:hypothetical protein
MPPMAGAGHCASKRSEACQNPYSVPNSRYCADLSEQSTMSAYHNGGSTYNLHAPVSANANSDAVNQQQHQHQPPFQGHHGLASPVQPYPYDPTQQDSAQAYNDTRAQTPQTPDNGVDKPKWKGNRLRKACDSCSIRKVRVSIEISSPSLACRMKYRLTTG